MTTDWGGAWEFIGDAWEGADKDIPGVKEVDENIDESVEVDLDDIVGVDIGVGSHAGSGRWSGAIIFDTKICGVEAGASTDVWSLQQQQLEVPSVSQKNRNSRLLGYVNFDGQNHRFVK